jgi:cyclic di-GMP phosphodiesterase
MDLGKGMMKPLCVMIAIQAVCLAFGLWLHSHFVIASAEWTAREQVWAELSESADELRPKMLSLRAGDFVAAGNRFDDIAAKGGVPEPTAGVSLMVVDTDWRVLFFSRAPSDESAPAWETGQTVFQEDLSQLKYTPPEAIRGVVHTAAGIRQALGWSLTDGKGFVLLHATDATPKSTAAMITDTFPIGGAVAFLWIAALQSIGAYIVMARSSETPRLKPTTMDEDSLRRAQDLVRTRDAVIIGLAKLAEARDTDTGQHLDRISLYCTSLASSLRRHPGYRDLVSPTFVRLIRVSSALHDIGKVGIEDAILLKPAKLTEEERIKMQDHALLGGECIQHIEQRLGASNFLEMAREIALYHHECWDGSGYPFGLKGEQIPLAARIVAIADVYDALAFKRVYKDALPHEKCVDIIRSKAGDHFDPKLVKVFLEIQMQFREIARKYSAFRRPTGEESKSQIDIETIEDVEQKVLAEP